MHQLEFRRQLLHLVYGPIIVFLYHYHYINQTLILGVIIGGFVASFLIKRQRLGLVARVLAFFEREHHMQQFPARGILFFTVGAYLCLILFDPMIAYAGILILSVGDSLTNIIGRHFGKIKSKLNPNKCMEGTIVGILASIPIAYYFFPSYPAAVSAAVIAMFLEIPHIKIFGFEIDDNLLIPLSASLTLHIWSQFV